MPIFERGTPINLPARFWLIDPITEHPTLTDPTSVTFTIVAPDASEQVYHKGDANVSNLSVGVWVCALAPPMPPGEYRWRAEGSGAVVAAIEGAFTVIESGVLTPDSSGVATLGPCSSWINGEDVAACGPDLGIGSDTYLLDDAAWAASALLYELSGRRFPGACKRTIRPCRDACSCWGLSPSLGLGPWYWTSSSFYGGAGSWSWRNECGDRCGCGPASYVKLAGYPVRQIVQVKIDGVALPEYDPVTGARNWRLDGRRKLIRMALPGPPVQDQSWPTCQDITLDDSQPSTFAITYTWGTEVPELGRQAAGQLAREIWNACRTGECKLPAKVTRIVRAGVTMDKVVATAKLLRDGETGLPILDMFMAGYSSGRVRRRPAVWSPDIQAFGRKVGQ